MWLKAFVEALLEGRPHNRLRNDKSCEYVPHNTHIERTAKNGVVRSDCNNDRVRNTYQLDMFLKDNDRRKH
jgi:hypothetical protein